MKEMQTNAKKKAKKVIFTKKKRRLKLKKMKNETKNTKNMKQ